MTSIAIDILDGLSSSTAIKGPCRVATTANITLSGLQTIDGVAIVAGDRVLVKDQTSGSTNGIYVADTGPWRRSSDFSKSRDVFKGTRVGVTDGAANAHRTFEVTSANPISVGSSSISAVDATAALGAPYVFVGMAQSNGAKKLALATSWPSNLKVWNWDQATGQTPGTAFTAADPTKMNVFWQEAAEYAIEHPLTPVYLINTSADALAIDNWLPTPPVFDMYTITVANIAAGLAIIGVDHIDAVLWWEGESSIADGAYVTKFNSVQTRFGANSWYRKGTPILIHGIIPKSIDAVTSSFNSTLMQCAQADALNRFYVFPDPAVIPAARWADDPHMDAAGYQMYGRIAYHAWMEGRAKLYDRQIITEPEDLTIGIGQLPTTDKVGITYSWNGSAIIRILNANAGSSASAQVGVQTNAGILGLIVNSIAGGASAQVLYTGAGNLDIATVASLTVSPGASLTATFDTTGILLATGKVLKVAGNQVVGPRATGWTAGTGTALKGAWAAYAGATLTGAYVQATQQASDNAIRDTSQRVKAIEDLLRTHGLMN